MLHINGLHKTFPNKLKVIEGLSLRLEPGEFVAIVGPSGCGKSTLLSLIAGLEQPTAGKIYHHDNEVTKPHATRGIVFQNFSLFPWLTVKQNIEFGLKIKNLSPARIREISKRYLELIGLTDFQNYFPKQLSGGMQQRVAIARTLAADPEIVLMDEPFGALDAQTKLTLQQVLTDIWEKEKKTVLFITHDIQEAVFLADKVYVMSPRPGKIIENFTINCPRPRTQELKRKPEFHNLVWDIQKTLGSTK
jgi:NitT/TauT family transport system ATP-binding protein